MQHPHPLIHQRQEEYILSRSTPAADPIMFMPTESGGSRSLAPGSRSTPNPFRPPTELPLYEISQYVNARTYPKRTISSSLKRRSSLSKTVKKPNYSSSQRREQRDHKALSILAILFSSGRIPTMEEICIVHTVCLRSPNLWRNLSSGRLYDHFTPFPLLAFSSYCARTRKCRG